MTAQTLTVISGIVLLLVFLLVGWSLRRRDSSHKRDAGRSPDGKS